MPAVVSSQLHVNAQEELTGWLADLPFAFHCFAGSIREFCDLDMPIVMFDKDGKYCILRLEEVS